MSERETCENCAKWADDFTKLEPELQRMVEFAKQCQRQRDELAEALRQIRDSTYRDAVTLRGMADMALARIDAEKNSTSSTTGESK